MRKILSASPLALCVLGALVLYGCSANGAAGLTGDLPIDQAPTPPAAETQHLNGVVLDWSTSHVVYPRIGTINSLMALQHDVRALQSWKLAAQNDVQRSSVPRRFLPFPTGSHRDWSINLGLGSVGNAMYPAKFNFDTTSTAVTTANCTTDFVVYPVNVAGSNTQPNIVAFDNIYSGTAPGPTGICNRSTPPSGDDGVSATTMWSYNVTAAGGVVATSPALSLDGTKIAFVESGATPAHFHVLAWKAGDGVDTITPNAQNVLKPVSIASFTTTAPVAGSGTASDLALTGADTLSSPFIDYANDLAYVGNDSGVIFRIKNVFCTQETCSGGVPTLLPSLDSSWGTNGALTVGGTCTGLTSRLSSVVVDGGTGNVFVGCADGKIYGFDSTGAPLTTASVTVGDGSATGGVVDSPIVDAVNHFVYGVSGSDGANGAVMVQASSTDLNAGSVKTSFIGPGGVHNIHDPSFSSGYFSSAVQADWLLYDWAFDSTGLHLELYGATFGAGRVMNAGAAADTLPVLGANNNELSPTTEFLNGSVDQLFVSGLSNNAPNFVEFNVSDFPALFPTSFPPTGGAGGTGATSAEGAGTSGMIVDNAATAAQASSVYFGVFASSGPPNGTVNNSAVKLTQNGLQ